VGWQAGKRPNSCRHSRLPCFAASKAHHEHIGGARRVARASKAWRRRRRCDADAPPGLPAAAVTGGGTLDETDDSAMTHFRGIVERALVAEVAINFGLTWSPVSGRVQL
jgi:hypothetical protein